MVVVPETHSDVFDGTKLIVQTLNSVGLGELGGKVNGRSSIQPGPVLF